MAVKIFVSAAAVGPTLDDVINSIRVLEANGQTADVYWLVGVNVTIPPEAMRAIVQEFRRKET